MSQPHSEAMAMCTSVTYTPYDTSSKEKTGNIITFTQFEEVNLLSETRNYAEIGDESDDNSIMPLLISEEEMDAMDYCDESDDETMSTEMLEEIRDGSQSRTSVNSIEACYKYVIVISKHKHNGKER